MGRARTHQEIIYIISVGWPGKASLFLDELEEMAGGWERSGALSLGCCPCCPAPDKCKKNGWMDGHAGIFWCISSVTCQQLFICNTLILNQLQHLKISCQIKLRWFLATLTAQSSSTGKNVNKIHLHNILLLLHILFLLMKVHNQILPQFSVVFFKYIRYKLVFSTYLHISQSQIVLCPQEHNIQVNS